MQVVIHVSEPDTRVCREVYYTKHPDVGNNTSGRGMDTGMLSTAREMARMTGV